MFGLEHITYWQFAKTAALLVCLYYVSVLLYLYSKSRTVNRPRTFEQEEPGRQDSDPHVINAKDLLSSSVDNEITIDQPLEIHHSLEQDPSGYLLDAVDNPDQKEREAFVRELHARVQKQHR